MVSSNSLPKNASKEEERSLGILMLIIGGILMCYAGVTGSIGIFETIVDYAKVHLGSTEASILEILLVVLGIIASLGGISVLAGAYMVKKGRKGTGKFIVGIGTGMGLIGLTLFASAIVSFHLGLSHLRQREGFIIIAFCVPTSSAVR